MSGNPELSYLEAANLNMTQISFQNNPNLHTVILEYNNLETLDLSNLHYLERLYLHWNRTMKEHGVRFALTKDSKDKYTLFFKCDNIDNFSKAYERYAQKLTKRSKNDPSIKKSLHEARKTAQTLSAQRSKEKNRSRGGLEL